MNPSEKPKREAREYGFYRAFLLGLKPGEVVPIDPEDQSRFLRAASQMKLCITTAKTNKGGMLLVRMKVARLFHVCPKCGYKR